MTLVRRFVLACMKFNVLIRADHIAGSKDILTDLLSRFQIDKFTHLAARTMVKQPTHIPQDLLYVP